MKAGSEIHFLAGQVFILGVACTAIVPRLPSDDRNVYSIGGRLSGPFRRALVALVTIGILRVSVCHFLFPFAADDNNNSTTPTTTFFHAVDGILDAIQVVGQSFLCLTTAYLLQCKLSNYINIEGGAPGRSLIPTLVVVFLSTVVASILSKSSHAQWACLSNLGEALSCRPIVSTLKAYSSFTTRGGNHGGRGPVLVQILLTVEYWFFTTSVVAFFAEYLFGNIMEEVLLTPQQDPGQKTMMRWYILLLEGIRQNQDNGVDDWARLLVHSIFLNSIDEMEHFTTNNNNNYTSATERSTENDAFEEDGVAVQLSEKNSLSLTTLHQRH